MKTSLTILTNAHSVVYDAKITDGAITNCSIIPRGCTELPLKRKQKPKTEPKRKNSLFENYGKLYFNPVKEDNVPNLCWLTNCNSMSYNRSWSNMHTCTNDRLRVNYGTSFYECCWINASRMVKSSASIMPCPKSMAIYRSTIFYFANKTKRSLIVKSEVEPDKLQFD